MYFEEAELENFYSYILSKKNQDKKVNEIRDIKKIKLKNSHKGVDFYDNHYRKK